MRDFVGIKTKGACQSVFQHILAERRRLCTKQRKEAGRQALPTCVVPGNCFYTAAVRGIGYRTCKKRFAESTTHPYRPHGKPTSVAGSEEQKTAEIMLQSHTRDCSLPSVGLRTHNPLPASPRELCWAGTGTSVPAAVWASLLSILDRRS